jgi:hypothetical protein
LLEQRSGKARYPEAPAFVNVPQAQLPSLKLM